MQRGIPFWELADEALWSVRLLLPYVALLVAGLALAMAHAQSKRLDRHKRRLRALADVVFDGLIVTRAGHVVAVNAALARLVGVGEAWFKHRRIEALLDDGGPSHLDNPAEQALILPDGGRHPVEVVARQVERSNEHVLAIRDLGPQKATLAQIERLSHTDPLTGVGNRQALERALNKLISLSDRSDLKFSLLRIDLDRFGRINESMGPSAADLILIQTARRLCATVRESDMVGRVASDEFVVLLPLAGRPPDASAVAERIITEMSLPIEAGCHSVVVGASIGVAIYPQDGATAAELMSNGALALKRAKKDGGGVWRTCQPGMDQQVREQQALAHDLGVALAEQQFSLAYQPYFNTQTLAVIGYEALLRWTHPVHGAISPARFIPIAEECGLIEPISLWVMRTACAEAASWTNPLSISVNLSPAQFRHEDVAERVQDVLREAGLAPRRLELEITEGVLMADTQRALDALRALRAIGVRFSMDDFGTGYSSLSYLRRFPFDKLKIDRSFIRDLDVAEEAQPIVQAIIALSRSLRLEVTAEGVETERQLAYLREAGCSYVQGYLVGTPEPATQIRWCTRPKGWAPDLLQPPRPALPAPDNQRAIA